MSDTPTKSSHTARNTGIGVAVALLLYVLSFGPANRMTLVDPNAISIVPSELEQRVSKIYAPVYWLGWHDKIISRPFLNWYCHLWAVDLKDEIAWHFEWDFH